MRNEAIFGVTKTYHEDEKSYSFCVGTKGNCPIALFLVLSSTHKNALARYFNLFTYSQKADDLQQEVIESQFDISRKLTDQFNGMEPYSDATIISVEPNNVDMHNYLAKMKEVANAYTDIKTAPSLELNLYADQFVKVLSMLTSQYDSDKEGTPQTCSLSSIEYWGRKEFVDIYEALDVAISHILEDATHVLQKRGFNVNTQNHTVEIDNFPSFSFKDYYNF